ncbi:MAG: hypothetical protein BWX80_01448 [Candidatus Hydrogenedentes bacterium ADurb.Bin101]|nr:MAG: hypothetical protein BWX80_01448 [Candidatus Hydrogenedentes bacterium ADurb.Bin101]
MKKITITTHKEQAVLDRAYWRGLSPEAQLDTVELLRIEDGNTSVNFIGFDDLIKNKRAAPRSKDEVDVEELL